VGIVDAWLKARRQEMKWGGVRFVKKVDLSSTQGALCTVSVFFILHFTYLGVRTHPPLPTGMGFSHLKWRCKALLLLVM